jgi:BirA family biotin operon repressor/biotin-[acetyl-CoA-carboxylase] ligase
MRRALPLATGVAVCNALRELHVRGLRLRWPNDVLVNNRKLAGLLIDQFVSDLAVIGIGLNMSNEPERLDINLVNSTARLADLVPKPPGMAELTALILRNLRQILVDIERNGVVPLFTRVNEFWNGPRCVELDLDGDLRTGRFTGIDSTGRLILADPAGNLSFFDAHQVRHLAEK